MYQSGVKIYIFVDFSAKKVLSTILKTIFLYYLLFFYRQK